MTFDIAITMKGGQAVAGQLRQLKSATEQLASAQSKLGRRLPPEDHQIFARTLRASSVRADAPPSPLYNRAISGLSSLQSLGLPGASLVARGAMFAGGAAGAGAGALGAGALALGTVVVNGLAKIAKDITEHAEMIHNARVQFAVSAKNAKATADLGALSSVQGYASALRVIASSGTGFAGVDTDKIVREVLSKYGREGVTAYAALVQGGSADPSRDLAMAQRAASTGRIGLVQAADALSKDPALGKGAANESIAAILSQSGDRLVTESDVARMLAHVGDDAIARRLDAVERFGNQNDLTQYGRFAESSSLFGTLKAQVESIRDPLLAIHQEAVRPFKEAADRLSAAANAQINASYGNPYARAFGIWKAGDKAAEEVGARAKFYDVLNSLPTE